MSDELGAELRRSFEQAKARGDERAAGFIRASAFRRPMADCGGCNGTGSVPGGGVLGRSAPCECWRRRTSPW